MSGSDTSGAGTLSGSGARGPGVASAPPAASRLPLVRPRAIHQLAPSIAFGDAVSNDCFELQRLFWSRGIRSEIFTEDARPEVRAFVRGWRDLEGEKGDDAMLLIHVSMGHEILDQLDGIVLPKAVVYHNITPAEYFHGLNPHGEHYSGLGREQLRRLAGICAFGFADSEFDRAELAEAGFARTAVVPILYDWSTFDVAPDARVVERLAASGTAIVAVGQILPQKAVHDVVRAFARYREGDAGARLYLVGNHAHSAGYLDRVRDEIRSLSLDGSVELTGSVPTEQLVAYYRGADAFVTLSEHEGFCVPLLEAMRAEVPIVAHAAGAIPETLGDAGLLLGEKSPEPVADAISRVVGDAVLRERLVGQGRARLETFSRERVAERLADALALGGIALPAYRRRTIAVLSSDQRCGIHEYSQALVRGLRADGHDVDFVGVAHLDSADLGAKVGAIRRDADPVIIEHEAGIFRDVPFVRALLRLRLRGRRIVLSMHELEPGKFHHFRLLTRYLDYRAGYRFRTELLRAMWVAVKAAWTLLEYRVILALMGVLPRRLVVHSQRSAESIDLLTRDLTKVDVIPLVAMPLEGVTLPATEDERRSLRARLGLPLDRFVFISPGFFFPRKRFVEVMKALPPEATLVLSGTRSARDAEYFDEVMAWIERNEPANVIVNTDYDRTPELVVASDAIVLYYRDIFQSAVAAEAMWAGLPCVFSDIKGFRIYEGAGLFARDDDELARAMRELLVPATNARLRRQVAVTRRMLAPERLALRYLVGLP